MATPALAQAVVYSTATSGTTCAATFGSNATTGNTYLVVSFAYGGASLINITGAGGIAVSAGSATFVNITSQVGVSGIYANCEAWIAYNITGGTLPQITCTYNGTIVDVDLAIYEWTNVASVQASPGAGTVTSSAGSLVTLPSLTTTIASDVLFAAISPTSNISAKDATTTWGGTVVFKETTLTTSGIFYSIVSSTQSGVVLVADAGAANSANAYIQFVLQPPTGLTPGLVSSSASVTSKVYRLAIRPDVVRF